MLWFKTHAYEVWAPFAGRLLLAVPFAMGTFTKIPGTESFSMMVAGTAQAGVPFATVAVALACILEAAIAVSLVLGWQLRLVAAVAVPYMILLTVLFHLNFSDPMASGFFIAHLVYISAFLYVSVYGARHIALQKDH